MKLLNITTSSILLLILTALSLWSIYFYYSIQGELYENIDEFLNNREFEIVQEVKIHPDFLNQPPGIKTDFKIEQVSEKEYQAISKNFHDIEIFEPLEREYEPYRRLETRFIQNGKFYRLIVTEELIDDEEIINTFINGVILLYVILLILLIFLNRVMLRRLWKPFYTSLNNLKKYRLDKNPKVDFDKTFVSEFEEMNQTVADLIKNNYEIYQNQKQFIENASHEMQTPLAKATGKIENFIQDANLIPANTQLIESINKDLDRLTGLNKSLLLLSKIENDQFQNKEYVNISDLITSICEDFEEFINFKNIDLRMIIGSNIVIYSDKYLMEILFRNLIKNAIYHNIPSGGLININLEKSWFVISNTGKEYTGDIGSLFNRFVKSSDNKDSLGLGLSIVKAISDLYNFKISYSIDKNIHRTSVSF